MREFLRNYFKIIIIILVLIVVGLGTYFLIKNNPRSHLTKEEKTLQDYSAKLSKDKFDLTGQVVNVSEDSKTITLKVENASKALSKTQNQEIKLNIATFTQVSDIKAQDKVNIKGSFSGKNYTAEYIARL